MSTFLNIKLKATFVALLIFTLYGAFAQTVLTIPKLPLLQSKIVYYDTVNIDTVENKDQLYKKLREWYLHTYETSDDKLTIDKSGAGLISGTGTINFREHKSDRKDLLFTIDVVVAKGYFVYKIYNLYGYDNGTKYDYSDIYSEELYTPPKPRWTKQDRLYKLSNLDLSIKDIVHTLYKTLKH
jgi:hypothetical protein